MRWLILFALFFSLQSFAQDKTEVLRIMNPKASLYEVLDVSPSATEAEIKKAYRRLVRKYHPDLQSNPANVKAATQVMTKLNNAGETLTDALKRKSYDLTVKATKPTAGGWKKWNFTDVEQPAPTENAKPKADAKTQAKPEPEKPKAATEPAKSASIEEPTKSTEVRPTKQQTISATGKRAQKLYSETSRCGAVGYVQTLIDIME